MTALYRILWVIALGFVLAAVGCLPPENEKELNIQIIGTEKTIKPWFKDVSQWEGCPDNTEVVRITIHPARRGFGNGFRASYNIVCKEIGL